MTRFTQTKTFEVTDKTKLMQSAIDYGRANGKSANWKPGSLQEALELLESNQAGTQKGCGYNVTTGGIRELTNGDMNKSFLSVLPVAIRDHILTTISNHYGRSVSEIWSELISNHAEHLLEYMTEPTRTNCFDLMQRKGFSFPY